MRVQDVLWMRRDKTKIRLGDMTHTHLANTIKMVKRRMDKCAAEIDACYSYFGGDHAMDAAEASANAAHRKLNDAMAWEEVMKREQKRRASLSTVDDAMAIMQEAMV